jgi:[ribosomal protein S5]-alanine N-acetyltransferase
MLETTRLQLVPLTHKQLILFKNDQQALAKSLDLKYRERQNDPSVAGDLEEAIGFWLEKTLLHRDHFQWFTNWEIILKHERFAIGGVGFAGLPDENGKTMVGYGLDVRYHNRGYATEALQLLIQWGFAHQSLRTIIADTPLQNIGSQKVLIKNGFRQVSQDEQLIHWELSRI